MRESMAGARGQGMEGHAQRSGVERANPKPNPDAQRRGVGRAVSREGDLDAMEGGWRDASDS